MRSAPYRPQMSVVRVATWLALAAVAPAVFVSHATSTPCFDVWSRPAPLVGAARVAAVRDGVLTLDDGRALRPAGIVPAAGVSAEAFDAALRVATAQGVLVERELGDGRAQLLAEPRFYNWCGTRRGWTRWAGISAPRQLGTLMVQLGYADPDAGQEGLTALERWRLEGSRRLRRNDEAPVSISEHAQAFRFDTGLAIPPEQLDLEIESVFEPPPLGDG